jgi:phage virion morphogenesis protein
MITVDVQDADVVQALQELQRRLHDMTPAMRDIGQGLESAVSMRFATQTDPNGRAWDDLRPSTIAAKAKAGKAGNKLVFMGDMLAGLSWQASADSARVGFNVPYAAYHEWGTRKMVRRGLLMGNPDQGTLGADDVELVLDTIADYLSS